MNLHHDSEAISAALAKVDMIEDWCKAVRTRASALLHEGYDVPGYKLVRGKRGNRAWEQTDNAAAVLEQQLGDAAFKPREVQSPSQAEKLLKKKGLTLESLGLTLTQSESGLHVAPEGDPRPAVVPVLAADEFNDLTGEKELA